VVVASTSEVVGERRQTTGNGIGGNDPNVQLARRKTEHLVLTGPFRWQVGEASTPMPWGSWPWMAPLT
jgi:hypothetical protein